MTVFRGQNEFYRALGHLVSRANDASRLGVAECAHLLQRQAQINSTGPPRWKNGQPSDRAKQPNSAGPGVVTGAHRRGIRVVGPWNVSFGVHRALVGGTKVYDRRLELGYTGTDSAGREYDQPPYPWLFPAWEFMVRAVWPVVWKKRWEAVFR